MSGCKYFTKLSILKCMGGPKHRQWVAFFPYCTHRLEAKFIASAMLNPWLNPE